MKFKEVFLVAVLILAGLVLFQFKTGKWDLDGMDWNWGDDAGFLVGREYAVEETRTIEAPLPPAIEIDFRPRASPVGFRQVILTPTRWMARAFNKLPSKVSIRDISPALSAAR